MSFILWFTGLSGAGKSTLAGAVANELKDRGVKSIEILDGDEVREHIDESKTRIVDYLIQHGLIPDSGRGVMHAHGGKLIDRIVSGDRRAALTDEAKGLRKLTLSRRELSDLLLIAEGALSPLEGF